jgi:hypothetical protein
MFLCDNLCDPSWLMDFILTTKGTKDGTKNLTKGYKVNLSSRNFFLK